MIRADENEVERLRAEVAALRLIVESLRGENAAMRPMVETIAMTHPYSFGQQCPFCLYVDHAEDCLGEQARALLETWR